MFVSGIRGLSDGRKVFLTIETGVRESTQSWAAMLRKLKGRGLKAPNNEVLFLLQQYIATYR